MHSSFYLFIYLFIYFLWATGGTNKYPEMVHCTGSNRHLTCKQKSILLFYVLRDSCRELAKMR